MGINEEKQEISLGMKQTQSNPWDRGYRNATPVRCDGQGQGSQSDQLRCVHRNRRRHRRALASCQRYVVDSQNWSAIRAKLSRRGRRSNAKCFRSIRNVAASRWGIKQLDDDPWATDIPDRYQPGQLGQPARSPRSPTSVCSSDLEEGLEGLLHISELADHKVENPSDMTSSMSATRSK